MLDWWNGLTSLHQVFYLIAIPATVVLLLQTFLLLFGLGLGSDADDVDTDSDLDHDYDHDDDGGLDSEHVEGLRLLTVRGLVAFLAVCGWVGIAMLDLGASPAITVPVSLLAGLGALVLVAVFMKLAWNLQQSGNLDVKNAIGATGEVYVPISKEGKGKVTLMLQERFVEMDAISADRKALKTGQRVRVVNVNEDNTLVVEPIA